MLLTFFMLQQFIGKGEKQLPLLCKNKTDVFSEFVNPFFEVYIETTLMKVFKGHLMMCFHKSV